MNDKEKQQNKEQAEKRGVRHWQMITVILMLYDVVAIAASYFLALMFRFDFSYNAIPDNYLHAFFSYAWIYVIVCIIVFYILKMYQSIWRFASYNELMRTGLATLITFVLNILLFIIAGQPMPASYYVFGICVQFILTVGVRFSYRFILLLRQNRSESSDAVPVMVVGAGEGGKNLIQDVRHTKNTKDKIVCLIDDNPNKWNRYVDGILVEGGRDKIPECAAKYNVKKIYIAIASATPKQRKDIIEICQTTDCEIKNLPGLYQFRTGEVTVSAMKDVQVEDLLGRDPVKVNNDELLELIKGRIVLVTGGGGSIGSEICRQIADHNPRKLIIFDIYENSTYELQQELKRSHPDLNFEVIIGSVRDSRKIFQVFEDERPEVVYHAAAHKHVPLMEDSPCEAVKNNAIGTYKTAFAAMVFGVKRFVLISTDKAVNPTNIMGASKRLCEMIIQAFDAKEKEGKAQDIPQLFTHVLKDQKNLDYANEQLKKADTEFVAVRFGNVLGSNGSVIPLFKKQIEEGGPVTVTHPDIIRYFMTIPEAVSLVLQAGYYAHGGEIFVLDMGEPVKIDDLARNLIRLSGHKPDDDIKIEYTGLRPGEKLYEEKLMAEEGLKKTANDMIHIGLPIPFDTDEFLAQLEELLDAAYQNRRDIRQRVAKVVTTYLVDQS